MAIVRRMALGYLSRVIPVLLVCMAMVGCDSTDDQKMSGEDLAAQLVDALHTNQFYKSATRAECEPVTVKAQAISDCTVWFKEGIYMGDRSKHHAVRVTIDDDQGHFSYWVSG